MEHIVLKIKDRSKINFLKEILKRMEFVEIVDTETPTAKEEEFVSGIKESVEWVNNHKEGKIKNTKSFQQLLDEL